MQYKLENKELLNRLLYALHFKFSIYDYYKFILLGVDEHSENLVIDLTTNYLTEFK